MEGVQLHDNSHRSPWTPLPLKLEAGHCLNGVYPLLKVIHRHGQGPAFLYSKQYLPTWLMRFFDRPGGTVNYLRRSLETLWQTQGAWLKLYRGRGLPHPLPRLHDQAPPFLWVSCDLNCLPQWSHFVTSWQLGMVFELIGIVFSLKSIHFKRHAFWILPAQKVILLWK